MAPAAKLDQRRRIIHHAGAVVHAGGEVVRQAQRVADFMRRQLPQARQHHALHLRRNRLAFHVGREQAFHDHVVLPPAQRTERHLALDDFAGARVGDARAIRPSARGAMHPLDHVIADVHEVGAFRHQLEAERVAIARRFERLVPPAAAFEQRGTDGLGRAAVEIIDDGLRRGRSWQRSDLSSPAGAG